MNQYENRIVNFDRNLTKMVMTLKKGTDRKRIEDILKKLRSQKKPSKGIDAHKYCGVITLKESPEEIQKRLRSEWD